MVAVEREGDIIPLRRANSKSVVDNIVQLLADTADEASTGFAEGVDKTFIDSDSMRTESSLKVKSFSSSVALNARQNFLNSFSGTLMEISVNVSM